MITHTDFFVTLLIFTFLQAVQNHNYAKRIESLEHEVWQRKSEKE